MFETRFEETSMLFSFGQSVLGTTQYYFFFFKFVYLMCNHSGDYNSIILGCANVYEFCTTVNSPLEIGRRLKVRAHTALDFVYALSWRGPVSCLPREDQGRHFVWRFHTIFPVTSFIWNFTIDSFHFVSTLMVHFNYNFSSLSNSA